MEVTDDAINNGDLNKCNDEEYLLTKEENQAFLSMLYLDLEHLCHQIEDNLENDESFRFK